MSNVREGLERLRVAVANLPPEQQERALRAYATAAQMRSVGRGMGGAVGIGMQVQAEREDHELNKIIKAYKLAVAGHGENAHIVEERTEVRGVSVTRLKVVVASPDKDGRGVVAEAGTGEGAEKVVAEAAWRMAAASPNLPPHRLTVRKEPVVGHSVTSTGDGTYQETTTFWGRVCERLGLTRQVSVDNSAGRDGEISRRAQQIREDVRLRIDEGFGGGEPDQAKVDAALETSRAEAAQAHDWVVEHTVERVVDMGGGRVAHCVESIPDVPLFGQEGFEH